MPDRSSRYLLDNNVFIAEVLRKWTKNMELIYRPLDSPSYAGSRKTNKHAGDFGKLDVLSGGTQLYFNLSSPERLGQKFSGAKFSHDLIYLS